MQTNLKIDELESTQSLKIGKYILGDRICNEQPISFAAQNVGFNYKNYGTDRYHVQQESMLRGLIKQNNNYEIKQEKEDNIKLTFDKTELDNVNIGINTRISKSCEDLKQIDRFTTIPDNLQNPKHVIFCELFRGGLSSREI